MRKILKSTAIVAAMALLLMACGAQAASVEDAGQVVNILLSVSETSDDGFFMAIPMIVSLDFAGGSIRVVYFEFASQIFAVTREAGELSIPMSALSHCDFPEIMQAFETTFGIPVDRYLNFQYEYGDFAPVFQRLGALCPITLDIPEELLGDEEYTTVNGYMKELSGALDMEYTPVTHSGSQEVGALALAAYFGAVPKRLWESGDQFTMTMEDYQYRDAKNRAVIEALKPKIAQMDQNAVLDFWHLLMDGQATNITEEDIAAWSETPLNFPDGSAPYLTVPGFEGVEMTNSEARSRLGVSAYQSKMLIYDNDEMARRIREFLYGQ